MGNESVRCICEELYKQEASRAKSKERSLWNRFSWEQYISSLKSRVCRS
jgi:hypothetical protein